jgi:hypothetical protein
LHRSLTRDNLTRPEVIPVYAIWKINGGIDRCMVNDVLLIRSTCFGCYEELVAKHELLVETESHLILWELVPHRSDDRGSFFSCMFKCRVEIVSLRVSLMDSI